MGASEPTRDRRRLPLRPLVSARPAALPDSAEGGPHFRNRDPVSPCRDHRAQAFGAPPGAHSSLAAVPPDFLNSREDAILVWTVVILSYVIYKDPRGTGGAFLGVLRALLHPKLLLLYGSAILYSALVVYGAKQ